MPEGRRLPELQTRISVDTTELTRAERQVGAFQTQLRKPVGDGGLGAFSTRLAENSKQLQVFGRAATRYLTLPIVAAGVVSVKLANDFDTSFTRMVNLAGVTAKEVDGLKRSVLDLSRVSGEGPQELADGLEVIRSAGITGAASVDTLTVSAKAAAIGLGSTREVADAITSVLNSYGQANISAAEAADILAGSVQVAKVEASEMAPQFGRLLPVAAALGIGFEEIGGALAELTRGSGDASQASTQLQGILQKLLNPGAQAQKMLTDVGLSLADLQKVVREEGLLAGLQLLNDRFDGNTQAMAQFLQDQQGVQGALGLLANDGRNAAESIGLVADATGKVNEGFDRLSKTDAFKQKQALADFKASMTELGAALAPLVADVAGSVADIARAFARLPAPIQAGLLAIAVAVGPASSALGLLGGRIDVLGTRARAGGRELDAFGRKGTGMARNLRNAALVIGVGVAAFQLTSAGLKALGDDLDETRVKGDRYVTSLKELAKSGEVTGALFENFGADLGGLADAIDAIPGGLGAKIFSTHSRKEQQQAAADIDELDRKLAAFARSSPENAEKAVIAFNRISEGLIRQGQSAADIGTFFDTYIDAATKAEIAARDLAEANQSHTALTEFNAREQVDNTNAVKDNTQSLEEQTAARKAGIDALLAELDVLFAEQDAQLGLNDAHRASQDALDAYAEGLDAAAGDSDRLRDALAGVADAEQGVTDASQRVADAIRGVAEAEQRVIDAQRTAKDAQEDLTDARRDAAEQLEDLQAAAESASIGEERAEIRLREAQERLRNLRFTDPRASADERRSAELDVEEARLALERARDSNSDAALELADAQRKGIEGSDLVVAAQRRLLDANHEVTQSVLGVGLAERAVTDARGEVLEAQREVTEAQRDYTEAVEEAKDALPELEDAAVKAAMAESKAAAAVSENMDGAIASIFGLILQLDPSSPLRKRLLETLQLLDGIEKDRTANIDVVFEGKPWTLQPRAEGGPVRRGIPYWVGEEGPEIVAFPSDGRIFSHTESLNLVRPALAKLEHVTEGATTVHTAAGVIVAEGAVSSTVVVHGEPSATTAQKYRRVADDAANKAVNMVVRGLGN